MTHASKALDARRSSAWNSRAWPIACGLLVFAELMAQVFRAARRGSLLLEDDAYYYTVIARNIVRTGASSFDGISLTNGYHPLWMIMLVAKDLVFGDSVFAVLTLEAALTAAAVWLFLDRGNCRQPWFCLPFVWLYMRIVPAMVLSGMEVSLLLFCVGLFVAALDRAGDDTAVGAAFLGGAAALVVGARIDSAFFVAPALLAAPISRRSRGLAFGVLGAAAGVYAIYDLAMFGMVLPVSSAVKSLGGVQWNGRLVAQMSAQWTLFHLRSVLVVTLLGLIVSPVLLVLSRPGTRGRVLATASTVGGVLYVAKLLFDSSWCIWAWYGFAVIFPVLAAFYIAVPAATAWWDGRSARRLGPAWSRGVVAVLTVGLALVVGRQSLKLSSRSQLREVSYSAVNRLAVARYGGLLGGTPVAMGDVRDPSPTSTTARWFNSKG